VNPFGLLLSVDLGRLQVIAENVLIAMSRNVKSYKSECNEPTEKMNGLERDLVHALISPESLIGNFIQKVFGVIRTIRDGRTA
jgi:hypothetical protein